jgi:hypothetical protein
VSRAGCRAIAALALGLAALAATGCKKPKPSILIISIDSLRADEVTRVENGRPTAARIPTGFATSISEAGAPAPASLLFECALRKPDFLSGPPHLRRTFHDLFPIPFHLPCSSFFVSTTSGSLWSAARSS